MSPPPASRWFDVEEIGSVTVVRFIGRGIWDEDVIQMIGKTLVGLVERSDHPQLLLDLGSVDGLASLMLSRLIMLHKKTMAAGGRMVLCKIKPRVYEIFEMLKLPQILHIYPDERAALQSF